MDNQHNLMFKLSRLFPSSCHFRTLPDVADTSITISKETHHSPFLNKPPNPNKIPKYSSRRNLISEGRKCPPVTPTTKMDKLQHKSINHSSSSHSGWFTSSDEKTRNDDVETDTLFSLSSNSGDSFRLKTSRRFRRCDEKMKSIDETARCSFSSAASSRRKTASKGRRRPETELGPDHISTQLYYNNDSGKRIRRRKAAKSRRKTSSRRSLDDSSMIGESYAVEKSSKDPRSDFRASMVEMIVEKQIFAAEDLKRLLLCFLSLNAVSYHGIIFDVFNEICQTLFAN